MTTQSTITPPLSIATIRSQLQTATGNNRVDLLNELSALLSNEEPATAEAYGQEALALATAAAYLAGQAPSHIWLGVVARNQGQLPVALTHLETALSIFESLADVYNIAKAWNELGITYQKQGNYLKALEFFQKSSAQYERLGEQARLASCLNNMAAIYKLQGDYEMALALYERTLKLKQVWADQAKIASTLNNLGNLYRETGDPQQALVYLTQAEALLHTAGNKRHWAIVLGNIAWCYTTLGELDKAEQMLLPLLVTHEALHNRESLIRALLLLAEIAHARAQYEQVFHYANHALALAEPAGARLESRDAHRLLAAAYAGVADYQAAYEHHQHFHTLDRAIFNYESSLRIAQIRSQYATEMAQKEADIYRLQNEELRQAKEAAEAANRAKSRFLAAMSHDLRTPLTVIIGYAELLQNRHPGLPGLAAIERSGRHLLALIQDILDLARVESGKLTLSPHLLNLPIFLENLREMMTPRAAAKGLAFSADFDPTLPSYVMGDQRRIHQILINLIDNAIKFTDIGQVTLHVTLLPGPDHETDQAAPTSAPTVAHRRFQFAVEDTGIGLEPAALATIFEPFQQVHNPLHNRDGLGLGLAISRQLAALMGGEVRATSDPGCGSTFFFEVTLPLAQVVAQTDGLLAQITGYEGAPVTILLVDDNDATRQLLRDRLEPLGFLIIEAADGAGGLAQALQHAPPLMLVDLMMPQVDGFALIRWVRATPHLTEMFAIALSASTFPEDVEHALAAGFDHFLAKPIDFAMLLAHIGNLLGLQWTVRAGPAP